MNYYSISSYCKFPLSATTHWNQ